MQTQSKKEKREKFWSLLIFPRHSTQEYASIVCNDEQGDLFYSAGPQKNQCQPQPTQEKLGRGFEKMQMNGLDG